MSEREIVVVEREFGISHADFFRIFPRVWSNFERLDDRTVKVEWPDRGPLTVRLSADKYRRLATLKIPYLDLRFEFEAWSDQQRAEFFEHFERSFQKGGG